MSDWKIPLSDITFDGEEHAAIKTVLDRKWLTQGEEVLAFEQEFASALESRFAIAVANGTAALHLAYLAAGLTSGDEFCLPALTFVATLNAGLWVGAKPVLVDCVSSNDWTLCPKNLERKITEKTRLIVTMPYGGFAPAMELIMEIANQRGIPVIEDACHAPLAMLNGKKIGTFGKASTCSFFGNKNMTTGEGGMILTDDEEIERFCRLGRSHGMTTVTLDRHRGHASGYDVSMPGFNYRMDEIRAAIGRCQLRKLESLNFRRENAAIALRKKLSKVENSGVTIPFENHPGKSANHLFPILLPAKTNREEFREFLKFSGIQTSIHYPPLHSFSHTKDLFQEIDLPVLSDIAHRIVTLPMGPHLGEEEVNFIAQVVNDFFSRGIRG